MNNKNIFIEDPRKAVFLTGFNKNHKGNWRPYREACYQKLKNLGVYIVKFDLPSYTDSAYLHCRTEQGAEKLLKKKFIFVHGHKILIYNYKTDKRSIESSLRASLKNSGYNSPAIYKSHSKELLNSKIIEEETDTAYSSSVVVSTPSSFIDKVDRFKSVKNLVKSNEYKSGIKLLRQISDSQKENNLNFDKAPGSKIIQQDDMLINIVDNDVIEEQYNEKYGLQNNILNNLIQFLEFPDFAYLFDKDGDVMYHESIKLAVNMYKNNIDVNDIKSIVTSQIVEAYAFKLINTVPLSMLT